MEKVYYKTRDQQFKPDDYLKAWLCAGGRAAEENDTRAYLEWIMSRGLSEEVARHIVWQSLHIEHYDLVHSAVRFRFKDVLKLYDAD